MKKRKKLESIIFNSDRRNEKKWEVLAMETVKKEWNGLS